MNDLVRGGTSRTVRPSPKCQRTPAPAGIADFYHFGIIRFVDLNIKGLDAAVGKRLRQQAEAAGLSVQQYLRNELTRIASRQSPAEFARGHEPMSRSEFEAIRQQLRDLDAAQHRL